MSKNGRRKKVENDENRTFFAINLLNSVRMFWNIHFKQRDDLNFLPTHNAYLSGMVNEI